MAIGCADWHDWSTPDETIWHIGKISSANKRARRFAEEVGKWQSVLTGFGISSIINFSLSNIEIYDPLVSNLGSRIDDPEIAQSNISSSNFKLTAMLHSAGANIRWFDHFQLWQQFNSHYQFETYEQFLAEMFSFDFTVTAPCLVQPGQLGPIWLDIQSLNFKDSVDWFREIAAVVAPDLPILAPFNNSGNWHAQPAPINNFPDNFRFGIKEKQPSIH